jgi:hypothetical protein
MPLRSLAFVVLSIQRHGFKIVDNSTNDIRIIGIITLSVLFAIALIGMRWETKVRF